MQGEKERQLLILLISGIIVVVIVSVLLLISVWKREPVDESEEEVYEVGKITMNESVSSEDYLKKYFGKVEKVLFEEDYDGFYDLLGEDYIQYSGFTKQNLKEYLSDKKIVGEFLVLKSYERLQIAGYSNVYIMNIKLKDGIYDINVVVREKSPNNFTIALDEYVYSKNINYNTTMNGVNLDISKVTYFSNYIEYDFVIKNVHDDTIALNANKAPECIYVKLANGTLISPYSTIFGGRKIEVEKDRIKEYTIRYPVSNENINQIESVVIKDIYYNGRQVTGDVEFILN